MNTFSWAVQTASPGAEDDWFLIEDADEGKVAGTAQSPLSPENYASSILRQWLAGNPRLLDENIRVVVWEGKRRYDTPIVLATGFATHYASELTWDRDDLDNSP
jgi:hypothetical protein